MDRLLKTTSLPAGLIALALCLLLLVPAAAHANYQALLLQACGTKGEVSGTFTQAEYRQAIANIPADADQYSNCRSILEAAQLAAAGGSNAIPEEQAASILATATPAERQAIAAAVTPSASANPATKVGDVVVDPAAFGSAATISAAINRLPLPLIITLALIGVGALAALGAVLIPRLRDYYRSR